MNPSPPSQEKNREDQKSASTPPPRWRFWLWYGLFTLVILWLWQEGSRNINVQNISYTEFKSALAEGQIEEVMISETEITGEMTPTPVRTGVNGVEAEGQDGTEAKPEPIPFRTIRVEDEGLTKELLDKGVEVVGTRPNLLSEFLWAWLLPIGLMIFIWLILFRRMGSAGQSMLNIGKSRAKLVSERKTGVDFDDVAGCVEAKAELKEIVDFLKNSESYEKLGARIPKGVLLVGPPGTGKTLLARAVAGEASVPFFSITGSDFVEMFVGVGAARVRDLFQQATKQAPCIVFIDELDAIGRQRSAGFAGAVNDEREQTLNQLLSEMDGFDPNQGVIVLSATNRPEVLDRALLRPGRFDRQVVVDAPDINDREKILNVHVRKKPLAKDVNLRKVAQGTPGFSGADLANAVNEAALLAVRRRRDAITQRDLEEAVEKVVAGPERRSRRLGDEEKRLVAYHEVGHALVAAYSKYAEPVHKISIVPRGRAALGYTIQFPESERFLSRKSELLDKIKGLLGGRAAEDVVFGELSTGSENDLDKATVLAKQMVCLLGMSDVVGLVHLGRPDPAAFLRGREGRIDQECSPETAREVDLEVRSILDHAYEQAKSILIAHRDKLDEVAAELLEKETIDAQRLQEILGDEAELDLHTEPTVAHQERPPSPQALH